MCFLQQQHTASWPFKHLVIIFYSVSVCISSISVLILCQHNVSLRSWGTQISRLLKAFRAVCVSKGKEDIFFLFWGLQRQSVVSNRSVWPILSCITQQHSFYDRKLQGQPCLGVSAWLVGCCWDGQKPFTTLWWLPGWKRSWWCSGARSPLMSYCSWNMASAVTQKMNKSPFPPIPFNLLLYSFVVLIGV